MNAFRTSLAALAALVLGTLALGSTPSPSLSNKWSWVNGPGAQEFGAGSPEVMVQDLARKLKTHPNDLAGWLMLGHSYIILRKYPLAERAYRKAERLAGGRSAPALIGEAQALTLIDGKQITGHAGDLFERALALAPRNPVALFYGAIVALHRGQLSLARTRFTRVLALDPSPQMKQIIQPQIKALDAKLTGTGATPRSSSAAAPITPTSGVPTIRIKIDLANKLARATPRNAVLYVFVRDAANPGLPLAVARLTNRFPQIVQLTPSDAMIPGHSFQAGERVEVVARIAPSGNPTDASGDLSGDTLYRVGRDGLAYILIDRVTR